LSYYFCHESLQVCLPISKAEVGHGLLQTLDPVARWHWSDMTGLSYSDTQIARLLLSKSRRWITFRGRRTSASIDMKFQRHWESTSSGFPLHWSTSNHRHSGRETTSYWGWDA